MQSPILLSQNQALPVEGLEQNPLLEYRAGLPKKPRRQHQEPEVAKLLNELREWCEQEHGRQTEVAQILGVDHRRLYDWFSGRISPTLAVGLRIQAFLASQKKAGASDQASRETTKRKEVLTRRETRSADQLPPDRRGG
jgi:hypothetical protein